MGFFDKIKEGLKRTRENVSSGFNSIIANFRKVDEEFLDELLELLITAAVSYTHLDVYKRQVYGPEREEQVDINGILWVDRTKS